MKDIYKKNDFMVNFSSKTKPFIIAELSANHNGSIERAFESIKAAKEAGADAVKIQTYTADTITIPCDNDDFIIKGGLWNGWNLYDLYKEAHTPYEWHKPLFDYAKEIGITIFSSPFDKTAVDLLEELNTSIYKVASFEIIDLPLIKYIAQTKKPMIISTGMANLEEITEAVEVAKENGCQDLVLLHCISSYPAPVEQSNLLTIPDLAKRFNTIVGLSDHTIGTTVATASVALGASVIEKHFTLSRKDKGPDSEFSSEPKEMKRLCVNTEEAWLALGEAGYSLKASEKTTNRRSLYIVQDIKKGELLTSENIRSIRPGYGLKPKHYDSLLGKSVVSNVKKGTPVDWNLIG
jgi:pseudaminic acid synthase